MRSLAFNVAYWLLSILYASAAAFAALASGRSATSWIIRRYVKRMVQAMRLFAGGAGAGPGRSGARGKARPFSRLGLRFSGLLLRGLAERGLER